MPRDDEAAFAIREIAAQKGMDGAVIGRFYTLLGTLLPRMSYRSETGQSALVDKAKRLILVDPHRPTRELAKQCAVSESALYAAFKKASDKSILEVRNETVLERAKELLISTDRTVEEISRQLEFSSSAYFRKCFKEHFGVSPRDLRKNYEIWM